MTTILVIEDDPRTATEIGAELARRGFLVTHAYDGCDGLSLGTSERWDALVLDRMLPGMDGLSVLRELRLRGVATPALLLSALDQVEDRIIGLRAGGDDYLVKPFAMGELCARLEVMVRRPAGGAQTVLHVGPLELDLIARMATCSGQALDLLPREFQLLEYFMRREGRLVTRQMLLEDVFGYRFELKTNLIDVHLGRLRRKLDTPGQPALLTTLRGEGYVLNAPR